MHGFSARVLNSYVLWCSDEKCWHIDNDLFENLNCLSSAPRKVAPRGLATLVDNQIQWVKLIEFVRWKSLRSWISFKAIFIWILWTQTREDEWLKSFWNAKKWLEIHVYLKWKQSWVWIKLLELYDVNVITNYQILLNFIS